MWVFDATPLIYLATVDRLRLVSTLEAQCLIPRQIYDDVVTAGIEAGDTDARRIEQCLDDGLFNVVSGDETPHTTRLRQNPQLSAADVAVFACAADVDGIAVTDEAYGRNAAEIEGIETRGTAYLVLRCAKHGEITVADARETIDSMIEAGWYCAPDLYTKLVRKLESFDG
ncbi:DUF3368 domain-containing protein [Halobacteria archaeon AArc-m2/3/4]|uniref:DUF3368 domain-containing protein n=1 Tax=Natronoglomus mannanivorans TaxID=2979990 RepID=A0ABT2QLC0_9EURY|nr:DUF3368 domain-containing protein [Halobacteria archaeon AArc-m2/3/4]